MTKAFPIAHRNRATRLMGALTLFLVASAPFRGADAITLNVDLQSAANFAVLGGSGITIAAPVLSTHITGDIGSSPTPTITGTENLVLIGTNHAGDATTVTAKGHLDSAYNDAATRTPTTLLGGGSELATLTLNTGVYNSASTLLLNGTLTLDAQGDPNAVFIFQMGSALTVGSGSSVLLINGAQSSRVFWQVGSSATLGTGTLFAGNILAFSSITATAGTTVDGRLLARGALVSLDNTTVVIPEPGSALLLGVSFVFLASLRRRKSLVVA